MMDYKQMAKIQLIDETFRAAVDTIFMLWNERKIDRTELEVRFDRLYLMWQQEYKKVLGAPTK